jgi:hypothetical protein
VFEMILRSAFWLCVGFALVAPHGTNFAATASQVRDQALAAGADAVTEIVVSQAFTEPVARAAMNKLSSFPSVASPMQDSSTTVAPVFPRPRPAAMG